jgi:hypothetical protein
VRKHIEISIGRSYISVEQIPLRWWLVDRAMQTFCSLTRCRFCGYSPVFLIENYSMNRPSRIHMEIPVEDSPKRELAEFLAIALKGDEWTEDEEPGP